MAIVCPSCNVDLPDDAVFCDQCGASLDSSAPSPAPALARASPAGADVCPQCHVPTIPGEAFCDNCGASLAAPQIAESPLPPVTEPEPVPAPSPAALDLIQCPACGADNLPDSVFCSNCGIDMQQVAQEETEIEPVAEPEELGEDEPEPVAELEVLEEDEPELVAVPEPSAPTGRFRFVVRDTGAEIALPTAEGEHIIGRDDPVSGVFPEVDMNPHDGEHFGVSRRHAKLIIDAGLVFIQDLDSTNFSFVDRQKLAPDTPVALSHGAEVRLGKLVMTFLE